MMANALKFRLIAGTLAVFLVFHHAAAVHDRPVAPAWRGAVHVHFGALEVSADLARFGGVVQ